MLSHWNQLVSLMVCLEPVRMIQISSAILTWTFDVFCGSETFHVTQKAGWTSGPGLSTDKPSTWHNNRTTLDFKKLLSTFLLTCLNFQLNAWTKNHLHVVSIHTVNESSTITCEQDARRHPPMQRTESDLIWLWTELTAAISNSQYFVICSERWCFKAEMSGRLFMLLTIHDWTFYTSHCTQQFCHSLCLED